MSECQYVHYFCSRCRKEVCGRKIRLNQRTPNDKDGRFQGSHVPCGGRAKEIYR
jgi:hypothetical protein